MNSHTYLITIVVPIFNAKKYIDQFLVGLLQQTFQNYEVLFLDNYSTDGTTETIKAIQEKDSRIKLVIEKDKGIYDAMNRGIELANSQWIYFMGSDDVFFNENVLRIIAASLTNTYELVYGDVLWVPNEVLEEGVCTPQLLVNRNINHQRIFYKKELFANYGGYKLQYKVAADHELNIRFFCNNSISKKYIPITIARYHSGGFSANKLDNVFWSDWKQIFKTNFSKHLPPSEMYNKLGWYSRYEIDRRNYAKAFPLFCDALVHNFSFGLLKLTFLQLLQSFKKNAG